MVELRFENIMEEIQQAPQRHPAHNPPTEPTRLDFFKRELMPGDFIVWLGGGYFSSYYNYGLVLSVNHERRFIRIRNENMNKITVWNTHNSIILARQGDYDNIPEEYLNRVGIENF